MLKQAKDKNSGQRNVRAKRSESCCLLLWQRSDVNWAAARYEVSITNETSSWKQRESYCVVEDGRCKVE